MGALCIGEAALTAISGMPLKRLKPRRSGSPNPTGAKVRGGSLEAGSFEESFFVPPAKGETDRFLRAARKLVDAGRKLRRDVRAGTHVPSAYERLLMSLTASFVRVYEELLTLARLNRGRVYPSWEYLEEATGLGRATVGRALNLLEKLGLVRRQRRFKQVEGNGPGPRWAQTSNAYRLELPERVKSFLPRWMRPAPLPDDDAHRRLEEIANTEAMTKTLSCADFARLTVGGELGSLLARIGAAIDQREYQKDPEPRQKSN